jgi:hypothetical protein
MWMQIVISFVMMVVSYAIQMANAPKPQDATAGNLDVPAPRPGALLGVGFGTNLKKDGNVIYYGNASTIPIYASGGK